MVKQTHTVKTYTDTVEITKYINTVNRSKYAHTHTHTHTHTPTHTHTYTHTHTHTHTDTQTKQLLPAAADWINHSSAQQMKPCKLRRDFYKVLVGLGLQTCFQEIQLKFIF